jgi:galactokinase
LGSKSDSVEILSQLPDILLVFILYNFTKRKSNDIKFETMYQEIASSFREKFDDSARVFFSPGRINLLGEHVDYNDGFVLPAAIDKGVWFAVAANNSDKINCYSYDMDETVTINLDNIQKSEGWKNYILGVVHVLQEAGLAVKGFDCVFGGNLPVGAGLSSSAAVECGLAYALNAIFDLGKSRKELALLAQRAEHLYPGVQCGIMDQYASIMGMKDNIIMLDCRSIEHQYLPFQLKEHSLILFNSKVQHSLASGEYNIRRSQCAEGLRFLSEKNNAIKSFRDVSIDELQQYRSEMDETVYRRCSYVVNEIRRTRLASEFLTMDRVEEFGGLMYETHEGLSKDYEVSCNELDLLVDVAKQNNVTGARVMGGGFGGCTINLIRNENYENVIEKIATAYEKHFGIKTEVIKVQIGDGSHEIKG